jgi:hypothetical protein
MLPDNRGELQSVMEKTYQQATSPEWEKMYNMK